MSDADPHDIVPDDVDAETLAQRLTQHTDGPQSRCAKCGFILEVRAGGVFTGASAGFYCKNCQQKRVDDGVVKADSRHEALTTDTGAER